MDKDGKISISPTSLGIIVTTIITLFLGVNKFGELNGRLHTIENQVDFKELREQQETILKNIQIEINGAEKKLKELKEGLITQQRNISSNYKETKNNINKQLDEVSIKVNGLVDNLNTSINTTKVKKETILRELKTGINLEINRTNQLTRKLKSKLERLRIEIGKKKKRLSSLQLKQSKLIVTELQNNKVIKNIEEKSKTELEYNQEEVYLKKIKTQSLYKHGTTFAGRNKRIFIKNNKKGLYTGDIKNSKPDGCGIYRNVKTYIGQYRKGLRHGYGIIKKGRNISFVKYNNGARVYTLTDTIAYHLDGRAIFYGVNSNNHSIEVGFIKINTKRFLNMYSNGKLLKTLCAFKR